MSHDLSHSPATPVSVPMSVWAAAVVMWVVGVGGLLVVVYYELPFPLLPVCVAAAFLARGVPGWYRRRHR